VVCYACRLGARFVLCFPPKACDGPVFSLSIGATADSESGTLRRCRRLASKNFAVLYRVDQSESEHLQRNPEGHVIVPDLLFEVGLGKCALANRRVIFDTIHDPKLMDATVGNRFAGAVAENITGAVNLIFEANLLNGSVLCLETWYHIFFAEPVRNQIELRVFGLPRWLACCHIGGIGNEKSTRPTKAGMSMAGKALV